VIQADLKFSKKVRTRILDEEGFWAICESAICLLERIFDSITFLERDSATLADVVDQFEAIRESISEFSELENVPLLIKNRIMSCFQTR